MLTHMVIHMLCTYAHSYGLAHATLLNDGSIWRDCVLRFYPLGLIVLICVVTHKKNNLQKKRKCVNYRPMGNPPIETKLAKKKPKKNNLVTLEKPDIDRVSSIEQKELALSSVGVTREKVYREIKGMLEAVKVREELRDGEVVSIDEPDMAIRAKGVELALKAFGDLKEFDRAVNSVTHNKVIYQWNPVVVLPSGNIVDGGGRG